MESRFTVMFGRYYHQDEPAGRCVTILDNETGIIWEHPFKEDEMTPDVVCKTIRKMVRHLKKHDIA